MDYLNKQWQENMRIRVDFNYMMADYLDEEGIPKEQIEQYGQQIAIAVQGMKDRRSDMKWRELPYNQQEVVQDILKTARQIRDNYEYFVVLGIGGSALGPIAVHQALNHMHYNDLPKETRKGPKIFVEDNVDPERMQALLDVIDLDKTCFNVITKSGSTSETMAQLLIVSSLLKKELGEKWTEHIVATTDHSKGNLIKIAKENNLKTFYVPDGVGGRFSELSPVGLLAAAVCGIDIEALLAGAAYMDTMCAEDDIWKNGAYMLGLLQVISMQNGKNISVMMPYADSLKYMSDWYAQLWAESLGKTYDRAGKVVNCGQTPVKALGVTDQHSQVQLYAEGPYDKVVTFLVVDRYRCTFKITEEYEDIPDVSFLGGHTLNELIQAEQRATEYALLQAKRLNNTIALPEVNAFTIGQLLYFLEVQTAFAGELLNINAFDQPGVEAGKQATYALLGKRGFDEKRKEIADQPQRNKQYII